MCGLDIDILRMIKPSYDDIVRIELDKFLWDTVWPTTDPGGRNGVSMDPCQTIRSVDPDPGIGVKSKHLCWMRSLKSMLSDLPLIE